jgi:predicted nucleic acid-binding protein
MPTLDANILVASYDATDLFHEQSAAFLRAVARRDMEAFVPAFARLEVACVVARRFRGPAEGERAATGITRLGLVRLVQIDDEMLTLATQIGTQQFLRGADALYAATAQSTGSVLVSWDRELVERAGALTPADWLAAHP